MMIDRRTFIQSAALFATAPVIAAMLPLSSTAQSQISQLTGLAREMAKDAADRNSIVFKIDGWDVYDANGPVGNELLIKINQWWRTGWR
jgi:hypothetical protein